jgi:hypothetical protein
MYSTSENASHPRKKSDTVIEAVKEVVVTLQYKRLAAKTLKMINGTEICVRVSLSSTGLSNILPVPLFLG